MIKNIVIIIADTTYVKYIPINIGIILNEFILNNYE